MRIGVLGLQGDVSEHVEKFKALGVESVWVRTPSQLSECNALVIPGGESTTIGDLMRKAGLFGEIRRRALKGMPLWGTCAGAIIMAKKGDSQVKKTGQKLLGLMDMRVNRNAFGRQRESFEVDVEFADFKGPFPAVFIRAPAIEEVFGNCKPLALYGKKIVAARQGNFLATAFHPELTRDTRIHEYFLRMCYKV